MNDVRSDPAQRASRLEFGRPLTRPIVFAAVGITVALIATGVLFLMVGILGLPLGISYATQLVVGVNLNFLLNSRVTWHDRRALRRHRTFTFLRQWFVFVSGRAVTIALSTLIFAVLTVWFHYLIAQVVSIGIPAALNYVFNDRLVFTSQRRIVQREVDDVHRRDF